jgi:hypothetical protein
LCTAYIEKIIIVNERCENMRLMKFNWGVLSENPLKELIKVILIIARK